MRRLRLLAFTVASILVVGVAGAQTSQPPATEGVSDLRARVAELREQVRALTIALGACQANKIGPIAAPSPREAALEALRAVKSALDGGANIEEFKKYHLEAKVKVDALADNPENAGIRRVGTIYTDAASLLTASLSGSLSAAEVSYLKTAYKGHGFTSLGELPDEGFNSMLARLSGELASLRGGTDAKIKAINEQTRASQMQSKAAASELFAVAERELRQLKSPTTAREVC
jgi:hypothetical protein